MLIFWICWSKINLYFRSADVSKRLSCWYFACHIGVVVPPTREIWQPEIHSKPEPGFTQISHHALPSDMRVSRQEWDLCHSPALRCCRGNISTKHLQMSTDSIENRQTRNISATAFDNTVRTTPKVLFVFFYTKETGSILKSTLWDSSPVCVKV